MRATSAAVLMLATVGFLTSCNQDDDAGKVSDPRTGDGSAGTPATPCVTPAAATLPPADPALAGVTHQFYKITVVDAASGAPIAGAQLTTTSGDRYTSDDNGVVAYYEPGLMGRDVWFAAVRDGYEMPKDGLGMAGARLRVTEGGAGALRMNKVGTPSTVSMGIGQTRLAARPVPGRAECVAVHVVDRATQRGVPLVSVSVGTGMWLTDSQGVAAYCDPEGMGARTVQFTSHGYAAVTRTATLSSGQVLTVPMDRVNVAERLYRITGQGTYRDSLLLGLTVPVRNGTLNAGVTGQDSVISTVYQGKVFWTWGDTNNVGYALGNFATSAGTSELPGQGGLAADQGVALTYLLDGNGDFVKGVIPGILPALSSPTWMGALAAVPDASGRERLFGTYSKAISDGESAERGLARYDDTTQTFKSVKVFGLQEQGVPGGGQAMRLRSGGQDWVHYPGLLRAPATAEALTDRSTYEVFAGWKDRDGKVLDVVDGRVQYRWRQQLAAAPVSQAAVRAAGLDAGQSLDDHLRDVQSGQGISAASVSVHWNAHRGRFVGIIQQKFGTSFAGEIWYAEADTPMGPWVDARKVVSHDDYTFYNPYTHPYLSTDDGRTVYFEATYTATYSGAQPTPRYNYNQIMYRVDTGAAALAMPVPVYDLGAALPGRLVRRQGLPAGSGPVAAAFLAPDHAGTGTVPVGWDAPATVASRKLVAGAGVVETLFHALPVGATARPSSTVALYGFTHADGRRAWSVDAAWTAPGFQRDTSPVAYVWRNPVQVQMPVADYLALPTSTLSTCALPAER